MIWSLVISVKSQNLKLFLSSEKKVWDVNVFLHPSAFVLKWTVGRNFLPSFQMISVKSDISHFILIICPTPEKLPFQLTKFLWHGDFLLTWYVWPHHLQAKFEDVGYTVWLQCFHVFLYHVCVYICTYTYIFFWHNLQSLEILLFFCFCCSYTIEHHLRKNKTA